MIAASVLLGLLVGVLLLPSLSDLLSLICIALGRAHAATRACAHLPRLLFLVPAHNEELLIQSCLQSLQGQRYPPERRRIVVIADNCMDRTASLARAAGAHCLDRRDPDHPGKPSAIAWGLKELSLEQVDAVVIVDADTVVDAGFAAALAAAAPLRAKVVQAHNGVRNRTDNALTRMAAVLSTANHRFAFGLKNRAGLNVPLSSGMCLGTEVLAAHGWSAFSICEDWEMYALLTTCGTRIESVPDARILAQEARSLRQSASQRRRWTAGKLTVLARYARVLTSSQRVRFSQKLDCLAELSAPGPAVQLGVVASTIVFDLVLQPPGAAAIAVALGASLLRWSVYAAAALCTDPEPARALRAFALLPFYTVWRAGIALAALTMLGDQPWVRTGRHPHASP